MGALWVGGTWRRRTGLRELAWKPLSSDVKVTFCYMGFVSLQLHLDLYYGCSWKHGSLTVLRVSPRPPVTEDGALPFAEEECKFTCTSGKCLYLGSLVCNQQNDCGDNSDEENCLLVTEHPPPGIFNCKSLLLTLAS
ncbi:hypothetical protein D623_10029864 [Myotis brandtii]|uniref:Low-density lipoprotein receptor class A domain-containing protein 4 n=1 Tax=Myotis brandtii TaxID=109478 RepID=S7PCY5_MYOBR|nr:hypothetical protein D623_10029864 [Myotis brandtii]